MPCERRQLAQQSVAQHSISIRFACCIFAISETCYRYKAKLADDNTEIAQWLIQLTDEHKDWGFGLCFNYIA